MSDKEHLFIGGASDGKRMKTENQPFVRLLKPPHGPMDINFTQSTPVLEVDDYRRERLWTSKQEVVVYVEQSLPLHDALMKLLESYRPI